MIHRQTVLLLYLKPYFTLLYTKCPFKYFPSCFVNGSTKVNIMQLINIIFQCICGKLPRMSFPITQKKCDTFQTCNT